MPKKIREIIRIIINDGWYLARQVGSHRQFKHPKKSGTVTIACHRESDEVPIGTEKSILKQAGLLDRR